VAARARRTAEALLFTMKAASEPVSLRRRLST
jgi:hypothetical protein